MINRIEKRRKAFQVSMWIDVEEDMDAECQTNEANIEDVLDNSGWLSNMLGNDAKVVDVSARLLNNEIILTDEEYEDGIDL